MLEMFKEKVDSGVDKDATVPINMNAGSDEHPSQQGAFASDAVEFKEKLETFKEKIESVIDMNATVPIDMNAIRKGAKGPGAVASSPGSDEHPSQPVACSNKSEKSEDGSKIHQL